MGNAFGFLRGKGEKGLTVMLAGHCDEIGFMVKFIDEQGFVYFAAIGGIDEQLLPVVVEYAIHEVDGFGFTQVSIFHLFCQNTP